uniref:Putative secreted protein n=1 Tax=Anopheles darlingi TaxID=43151 RepID=A0A2M4D983_ANODA
MLEGSGGLLFLLVSSYGPITTTTVPASQPASQPVCFYYFHRVAPGAPQHYPCCYYCPHPFPSVQTVFPPFVLWCFSFAPPAAHSGPVVRPERWRW